MAFALLKRNIGCVLCSVGVVILSASSLGCGGCGAKSKSDSGGSSAGASGTAGGGQGGGPSTGGGGQAGTAASGGGSNGGSSGASAGGGGGQGGTAASDGGSNGESSGSIAGGSGGQAGTAASGGGSNGGSDGSDAGVVGGKGGSDGGDAGAQEEGSDAKPPSVVEFRGCDTSGAVSRINVYRIDRSNLTCAVVAIQENIGPCQSPGFLSGGWCLQRAYETTNVAACEARQNVSDALQATTITGTFTVTGTVVDIDVVLGFPSDGGLPQSVAFQAMDCRANCAPSDCRP